MPVLREVIASLEDDAPVFEVCQGVFQTAVVSRGCGLAATLCDADVYASHQRRPPVNAAGGLQETSAREMAGLAFSESLLEASLGMAALNSLIRVDTARCADLSAQAELLARSRGSTVVMVGHFPFVDALRAAAAALTVIEKRPRPGDQGEDTAAELIPRADVVAITGTAFTNHTIDGLLALCRGDAYVMLLGSTAPLSPVLFDHGVSAVAGNVVTDAAAVIRGVGQGGTYRQLQGLRRVVLRRDAS